MSIFGYIDPGLGLLAWQAVVAAFLGLLFYVKKTRSWVAGMFRKVIRADKPPQPAPNPAWRDGVPAPNRDARQ